MADQTPTTVDLTPEIIALEVQQGTDALIEFALADASGTAVDLTADTVKFTAKDAFGGTITIATKVNGPSDHTNASGGTTRFLLSKTDLTTDAPDSEVDWVYEIRRVFDSLEVIYIHGTLKLMPSVGL